LTICVDKLLDAAQTVVLQGGAASITLDAVAAEAGVSKGGLLHHFPSKEKLIEAMVVRIVAEWRQDVMEAIEAQAEGPGRVARAFLAMSFEEHPDFADCVRRSTVVLLTALTANPKLLQPLRDVYRELERLIENDGLRPGYGEAILSAIDGLWFAKIFGTREVSAERSAAIRASLVRLVEEGVARSGEPPGTRETKGASA
jgi:AcrR family transcriptional regulator